MSVFIGYMCGRTFAVPGSTDFWKAVGPPIATFGAGLCTLTVGFVAFFGVILSAHIGRRATERMDQLARCWERFTWVVEQTSGSMPGGAAALFPPEVRDEVVRKLVSDAERLDDGTLLVALTEYQTAVGEEWAQALNLAKHQQEAHNGNNE